MAKPLMVTFESVTSSFDVSLLDRSRIYGSRRRVALDSEGQICTRAALTADGGLLLTQGTTAQGYFTPSGKWVPRSAMTGIDSSGQSVSVQPSTLGVPQAAEGPVSAA